VASYRPSVIFEITDLCDCRCSFCYEKTRRSGRHVSPRVFERVLRETRPLYLQITGGEALLHPEIEACLTVAARRVPVVQITTNGTQLERKMGFLAGMRRKPMIGISLDFADERHDRVRGRKGLFRKIEGLLPRLKAHGIPVALSTTVFGPGQVPEAPEGNLDQVPALIAFSTMHDIPINVQSCSPAVAEVRVELGNALLGSRYPKLVNSIAYRELLVKGHDGRCRYNWTHASVGVEGGRLSTEPGNCYFCGDCTRCYYSCVWEPTLLASRHLPRQIAHFARMELHMIPALDRLIGTARAKRDRHDRP